MDPVTLGQLVLPVMERLSTRLPQLRCAALCMADGFNVCSIGITEVHLGRMAALAGSLLTIGETMLDTLSGSTVPEPLDVLTLQTASGTSVAVRVDVPGWPLVLMLSATAQTPLGVLHLCARDSAAEIVGVLDEAPVPPPGMRACA